MIGVDFALLLNPSIVYFLYMLGALLATSPIVYLITVTLHCVYKHKKFGLHIVQRLRARRNGYKMLHDPFPDQIEDSLKHTRVNLANVNSQQCNLDDNN